jgi:hypothetical protein
VATPWSPAALRVVRGVGCDDMLLLLQIPA